MVATRSQRIKPTAEDIERSFPEAVALAKALREVFGSGVKILYARNTEGDEIGRRNL